MVISMSGFCPLIVHLGQGLNSLLLFFFVYIVVEIYFLLLILSALLTPQRNLVSRVLRSDTLRMSQQVMVYSVIVLGFSHSEH